MSHSSRHGVRVYFSLSLYPYGEGTPTYAQYYEAGYQKGDYGNPDSKFCGQERGIVQKRLQILRVGFDHSRMTAELIGDAVEAERSGDEEMQRKLRKRQRELREFRLNMFKEYPYAVYVPSVDGEERARGPLGD